MKVRALEAGIACAHLQVLHAWPCRGTGEVGRWMHEMSISFACHVCSQWRKRETERTDFVPRVAAELVQRVAARGRGNAIQVVRW